MCRVSAKRLYVLLIIFVIIIVVSNAMPRKKINGKL